MEPLKIPVEITGTKKELGKFASDVKQTNSELKKDYEDLSNSIMGKEVSRNLASAQLQMNKMVSDASNVVAEMKQMENTQVLTPFGKLDEEFGRLSDKMVELTEKKEQYEDANKKPPVSLLNNLENTEIKLQEVKMRMLELSKAGQNQKTMLESETPAYQKKAEKLDYINSKMSLQSEKITELAYKEGALKTEDEMLTESLWNMGDASASSSSKIGMIASALGTGLVTSVKTAKTVIQKMIPVLNAMKKALGIAFSGAKKLGKGLLTLGKNALFAQKNLFKLYDTKIGSFFKKGSDGVHDMSKAFKRGLTKVFAYGFGIRSLFRLFNKLRGYAKDALNAMAQQFDDVNKDLSAIVTGFNRLKNSIGTAVQPIVSALTPALVTLEKVLSNVLVKIGEFFAVLTGQKYIYKAIDAEVDYAASLDNATDSTEANTKATEDNQKQLGYYDKLNVIGQDDDSKKSDDDTGAGDVTAQFEKVDPTKAVSEFAKKVRQAWEDADFTEVGNIIGKKLQSALQSIPWEDITTQAQKVGKSLGTLINGFVETETGGVSLGSTIGSTLASAINAGVAGITSFLDTTHWDSVGTFFTDGINTAISEIKWDNLGSMIGKGLTALWTVSSTLWNDTDFKGFGSGLATALENAIKDTDFSKLGSMIQGELLALPKAITGFVEEIDWDNAWENFKTKVQEFISGFDFKEIFSTLGEMSGAICGALYEVVSDIWEDIKSYFEPYVKKAGGNIWLGILNGIVDAIKNIASWINDNVVQPFINGFNKGFGITSDGGSGGSSVMKKIGKAILRGLTDGVKAIWVGLKAFLKLMVKGIKAIFKNLPNWFGKLFKLAFKLIKLALSGVKTFFKGVLKGIKSVFSSIATWFGNKFDSAVKKIKNAFKIENIKKFFTDVLDAIKEVFDGVVDYFKTTFNDAWAGVKTAFSEGGKLFKGIKEGIVKAFKSIVNTLIKGINSIIRGPFKAINKLLNKIRNAGVGKVKPFKGLWDKDPLEIPKIPKLAQGAVIPPNKEFLAMLGDQKQGTNIEAPLDTIVEAFNQALAQNSSTSGTNGDIVVKINSKEIARAVWSENDKKYKQNGAFIPKFS